MQRKNCNKNRGNLRLQQHQYGRNASIYMHQTAATELSNKLILKKGYDVKEMRRQFKSNQDLYVSGEVDDEPLQIDQQSSRDDHSNETK